MTARGSPSRFLQSVLHNGVGRYVCQLKRLTLIFSKDAQPSRGAREYIEEKVVDFAHQNPGIVVYISPKPCRVPKLVAEYFILNVKKPLQPIQMSCKQVALEMFSLCSQLDILIRGEVQHLQEQAADDLILGETDIFHALGSDLIERMRECLCHLPEPAPCLEDYLDTSGLSVLFPRVEIYIIHERPVDILERPPMDDYFAHIGKLNQLLVLSQQLEDDVKHLGSHKYVAHQLSVLYKVLSYFNGCLYLDVLKRDIETNFKSVKSALMQCEGSRQEPLLPGHLITWLLGLTQTIITTVSLLPEELTGEILCVLAFSLSY